MNPPYRILHVIDHLGTGGAQEVVCQLVKYSRRRLFQPEVLTLRGLGHYWQVLRHMRIPVHSLFPYDLETFKYFGCLETHMLSRLYLFLKRNPYDLVHSHLLWPIMMATPMAALCGVPVRLNHEQVYDFARHVHGNEVLLGNRRRRRLSNRLCHHIIAGSNSIRNFACEVENITPEKVSLIYNAVDLEQLSPQRAPGERERWRRTWRIPEDSLVVGGIGRLDPQKNFPMFLEVAAALSKRFPQAMFVIAGDGKERDSLEALAQKLGIGRKVLFLGFVKELRELYLVMDVLLFPSLYEGTPLTIFGALAMGLPVVASKVDGIAETLNDGEDALLVPPQDKELFVHQVSRVLQDQNLAQQLAQTGQTTVFKHYSAQAMVTKVEALYLQLLGDNKSRREN